MPRTGPCVPLRPGGQTRRLLAIDLQRDKNRSIVARRHAVIRTQSELHVAASPEVVFDRFVDMRNDLHWNPLAVEMTKATEGGIGNGTRFEGKMKRVGPM